MDAFSGTFIDIIVLVLVILSGGLAAVRGFTREFLSILSWGGATLVAIYGYPHVRPHADGLTDIKLFADAGTAIILFILSLAILSILSSLLSSRIKDSAIGALDRAIGFLFGVARGIFLICLLFIGANFIWEEQDLPDMIVKARSYPAIKITSARILAALPQNIQSETGSIFSQMQQKVDQASTFQDQYEKLNNPLPSLQKTAPETAYENVDRLELEKLIEDTQ